MDDDPILTIDEVAKYLRVSERTVYDWAHKGEIPSGKIGTVWRFKKSEIEKWVNQKLSGNQQFSRPEEVNFATLISPDRIVFLNHSLKRDALLDLAKNISTAPQIKNPQELKEEILKREKLMSTAIGKGIAIPHVRLSSVTDLVVSIGLSSVDIIDFQALDDEPVRFVIMSAAASGHHAYYLKVLSFFSAQLKNSRLRNELLAAKSPQDAYKLFMGHPR
jgi:PTS system nitrogen regulatory IIA component